MFQNYTLITTSLVTILFLITILISFMNTTEYYAGSNVAVYSSPNLTPITYPPYEYHCVFGVPPYNDYCNFA
jgi:hypothetical protein